MQQLAGKHVGGMEACRLHACRSPPQRMAEMHSCHSHSQATCFIKGPAAWKRTPRRPDLTSGLVTSVTLLGYDEPLALSNNDASSLDPEQLARAPLQGTTITGWVGGWGGRARRSCSAAAPPLAPGPADAPYGRLLL